MRRPVPNRGGYASLGCAQNERKGLATNVSTAVGGLKKSRKSASMFSLAAQRVLAGLRRDVVDKV